jgi:hypothetical protein
MMTVELGRYYKHKKTGGLYMVVGLGVLESNLEEMVLYRYIGTSPRDKLHGTALWIRPKKEFEDGRFKAM